MENNLEGLDLDYLYTPACNTGSHTLNSTDFGIRDIQLPFLACSLTNYLPSESLQSIRHLQLGELEEFAPKQPPWIDLKGRELVDAPP